MNAPSGIGRGGGNVRCRVGNEADVKSRSERPRSRNDVRWFDKYETVVHATDYFPRGDPLLRWNRVLRPSNATMDGRSVWLGRLD